MHSIAMIYKNIFVQCILLFIIIVGGYAVYVNVEQPKSDANVEIDKEITNSVVETSAVTNETPEVTETRQDETAEAAIDLKGTHIMKDGSVMTGSGVVLSDASILPDGTIVLGDGTTLTPVFDMREKQTETASSSNNPAEVTIDVVGTNFAYDVEEIKVKQGDTVTIYFESSEGFHDWVIDEFEAKTERVDEGVKTSVTFIADKVGTYQYYCSVRGHREKGQVGKLIVE